MIRAWLFLFSFGILLAASGCATFPKEGDYTACDLRPDPMQPVLAPQRAQAWLAPLMKELSGCDEEGGRFSVLSISGGGADGAFGAGFLASRILTDESFHPCLITGVSTGAVMGSYAYLATSQDKKTRGKYLPKLDNFYQNLDDKNLVSKYPLIFLPFHVSLYDVSGIRELLEEDVDEALLQDIEEEYSRSRRAFFIGATDLKTGEFDIIDLTDYVSRNRDHLGDRNVQACYREAIRASAAIPLAFPPVPIKDGQAKKIYVDGGVRRLMFLDMAELRSIAGKRELWVYGIVNNTFDLPSAADSFTLLDAVEQNTRIATDQLYMDSAYAVDSASSAYGAHRRWATMLGNNDAKACISQLPKGKLFDPRYQKCLFDIGSNMPGWSDKPWPVYTLH